MSSERPTLDYEKRRPMSDLKKISIGMLVFAGVMFVLFVLLGLGILGELPDQK